MKKVYKIKTHETTDWVVECEDIKDAYWVLLEASREYGRAWLEVKNE